MVSLGCILQTLEQPQKGTAKKKTNRENKILKKTVNTKEDKMNRERKVRKEKSKT